MCFSGGGGPGLRCRRTFRALPSGHVIPLSEISLCGPILQMGKMRLKRSDLPAALAGSAHRGGHAEREKTRPGSTQTSSQVGRGLEDRAGCPGRGFAGGAGPGRGRHLRRAVPFPERVLVAGEWRPGAEGVADRGLRGRDPLPPTAPARRRGAPRETAAGGGGDGGGGRGAALGTEPSGRPPGATKSDPNPGLRGRCSYAAGFQRDWGRGRGKLGEPRPATPRAGNRAAGGAGHPPSRLFRS